MLYHDTGPETPDIRIPVGEVPPTYQGLISLAFLFGTQPINHPSYKKEKSRRIKQSAKENDAYFLKVPIILTAVPHLQSILLAVNEGHNRIRVAGSLGYEELPALIYSIDQVAAYSGLETEETIATYLELISYAAKTFEEKLRVKGKSQACHQPLKKAVWESMISAQV